VRLFKQPRLRELTRGRSLQTVLRARIFLQSAVYTVSNVLVSLLGMLSTAILARAFGPTDFGRYAFLVAFITFASIFFEFGVFLPAARLAASREGDEQRSVLGAALLAFIPIGLAFSIVVFVLSYVVDVGFHEQAGHALRVVAPLALAYPFLQVTLQLSQGIDRLHTSSITTVIAQGVFVLFVLGAASLTSLTVYLALVLRAVAFLLAGGVFVVWIRPLFRDCRRYIKLLLRETRAYGFSVYIGRVLGIGTYNMDVLMLAAFTDARTVGFYTLAGAIAYASGLPVVGMANALFARMTKANQIDRRWIVAAWGIGAVAVLLALGLARPFVEIVFSPRYRPVVALVLPLALAQMVRGVTTIYNMYLSAHARGGALRNAAGVLTVSNVIFNFALIPPFGAMGAAWASFFALVLNLIAHVIYYRRSVAIPSRTVVA
jgi:O-antigen/teichoic acid export membrane protein